MKTYEATIEVKVYVEAEDTEELNNNLQMLCDHIAIISDDTEYASVTNVKEI